MCSSAFILASYCSVLPILALATDAALGELRRWHPLAGFGLLARLAERALNRQGLGKCALLLRGAIGWALLVLPLPLILAVVLVQLPPMVVFIVNILILYLSLGLRSLYEHAQAVLAPLQAGNLPAARQAVSMLVSRDTAWLDEGGVSRAALESVLENGSDAVVAPLFWGLLAGAPAVVAHRLINTLDASWGYRNERYLYFGRVAARADDIVNFLPARLCALFYALAGHTPAALCCWRKQAGWLASPNGGPVMTAGAGALGVRLGGVICYGGKMQIRGSFGYGQPAQATDIARGLSLLLRAVLLFILLTMLLDVLVMGVAVAGADS
ncbi:MAG: adenosylcobinamide-phosphate synthase CbiB [Parahaliea sp.]